MKTRKIALNLILLIIYETIAVFVHISAEPSNSQVFQNEFFLVFRTIIRITIIGIAYYEYVNTHNISYEEQLDNLKASEELYEIILKLETDEDEYLKGILDGKRVKTDKKTNNM